MSGRVPCSTSSGSWSRRKAVRSPAQPAGVVTTGSDRTTAKPVATGVVATAMVVAGAVATARAAAVRQADGDRLSPGYRMMMRRLWPVLIVGLLSSCMEAGEPSAASSAENRFRGKLQACEWPGYDGDVLCGTYEVPEDRSVREGRTISLRVAVLPATGPGEPASDALAFLAGGGVAPATNYLPFFGRALRRLSSERDILLVDQRGTGGSNPLRCDLPEPHDVTEDGPPGAAYDSAYLAALGRCRAEISEHADPALYTTWAAADDLNAVRAWLGYDRLSLWGASYGTKAARVFMRRHPDHVRAAVLHGVVPLEFSMWPDLFPAADSALGALFELCSADPGCAKAYPRLDEQFTVLIDQLERAPVPLRAPVAGAPADTVTVWFDGRSLAGLTVGYLRSSRAARRLPELIDEMAGGDFTRVARMQNPGAESAIPRGVYLSIACSEEFPRLTDADVERASRATRFGPGEWFEEERRECEVWGAGSVPASFWDPVVSDAPVLVLSGAEDFITPPGYAESVAGHLSNATLRVLPQRGHDDIDPCATAVVEEFLIQGRATDPDLGCPEDLGPLPFDLPRAVVE